MSEQHIWQRRAVRVLGEMLDQHGQLPVLQWTVGTGGSVLTGAVAEHDSTKARAQFDAWRAALGVEGFTETSAAGRTYLQVVAEKTWLDGAGWVVTVTVVASLDPEPS